LVIVLLLLVVAVVAGGGYYVVQKNKDKSGGSNQSAEDKAASAALNEACMQEVNDDDFCRYASTLGNLYSNKEAYTAVTTSTSGDGSNDTIKSDGKGNMHTTVESSQGKMETILLNGTSYIKNPGQNVWYRMAKSESTPTETSDDKPEFDFESSDPEVSKT